MLFVFPLLLFLITFEQSFFFLLNVPPCLAPALPLGPPGSQVYGVY